MLSQGLPFHLPFVSSFDKMLPVRLETIQIISPPPSSLPMLQYPSLGTQSEIILAQRSACICHTCPAQSHLSVAVSCRYLPSYLLTQKCNLFRDFTLSPVTFVVKITSTFTFILRIKFARR